MPAYLEISAVATGLEMCQCSFQFQRREVPSIAQTTGLQSLFHLQVTVMLKILPASFSCIWTKNFQMYNLGLEKDRGTRD